MRTLVAVITILVAPAAGSFGSRLRSILGAYTQANHSSGIYYYHYGKVISPWHDVPFSMGKDENGTALLSFVCEIPLHSRPKNEIHKTVKYNPVLQDVDKDGALRYYNYPVDAPGSICNYGAITQTWEDPETPDPDTGLGGDNDPIDVLQLNDKPCKAGAIQRVRVIGALAMVDDSETDWKLLVVDVDASSAPAWYDVTDIPPERITALKEWYRNYKVPDGKGQNTFGLGERAVDAEHAMKVARGTHEHWAAARSGNAACSFKNAACWLGQGFPPKQEL